MKEPEFIPIKYVGENIQVETKSNDPYRAELIEELVDKNASFVSLQKKYDHDRMLKNLLSKEAFYEKSVEALKEKLGPFAFFSIDLRWFKTINDTYGHRAGDEALEAVSKALIEATRYQEYHYYKGVRVKNNDKVGRLGGDEFGILLLPPGDSNFENKKSAQDSADLVKMRFDNILNKNVDVTDKNGVVHSVKIGATIGVVVGDTREKDPNKSTEEYFKDIMHEADILMLSKKNPEDRSSK